MCFFLLADPENDIDEDEIMQDTPDAHLLEDVLEGEHTTVDTEELVNKNIPPVETTLV